MAFATPEDVRAALGGRSLDAPDDTVDYLLEAASDLIIGYMNWATVPDPATPNVVRVAAEMVANVLNRPQVPPDAGGDPYNPGQFAYQIGPTSVGPWLTSAQKNRLNKDGAGVRTLDLTSEIIGSDMATSAVQNADPYAGTDLGL